MNKSTLNDHTTSQLRVRLNLKAGKSIEQCTKNVKTWQKDFTDKYNKAVKNGYYPPFPNPLA
jgi:hypothetical protein